MFTVVTCLIIFAPVFSVMSTSDLNPNNSEILNVSLAANYTIQNETKRIQNTEQNTTEASSQIRNIERSFSNILENTTSSSAKKSDTFRPSPHLETIYEYNKVPVAPAAPEAKHISNLNFGERSFPWTERDFSKTATTEQPWVNKVVFPTSHVATSKDRPYQFLTSGHSPSTLASKTFGAPQGASSGPPYGYAKPRPSRPDYMGLGSSGSSGYGSGNWDKFETGGNERRPTTHKTNYEYGPPDKTNTGLAISPIKKIIGLLAAFIPIGLLISALTPSVIQITPVNMTQTRSRAENQENTPGKKLEASLNNLHKLDADDHGCEERILCELLLSAGASEHAETHVENLLQAFTEPERDAVRKAEELQKVYEAVKKQNCKALFCKTIKRAKKKVNTPTAL